MAGLEELDDAALLAAHEHAPEAFAVFYKRHVDAILRFFAMRNVQASDAADLTAETFAAALLSRLRFRSDRGTAKAWLFGIANNKLVDSQRRSTREDRARRRLALTQIDLTARDIQDFDDTRALGGGHAVEALETLSTGQQQAVYARVVDDNTYEQVGRRLGLSQAAARQRVSRGLAALRERLMEDR